MNSINRVTIELYRVKIKFRRPENTTGPEHEWVEQTTHVAVFPGWAGSPLERAGDLAVQAIVGEPDCWDTYMPTVIELVACGSVHKETNL